MARGQTKLNDISAYRFIRKCLIPSLPIAQKIFGSVYFIEKWGKTIATEVV